MKILVCISSVPDTTSKINFTADKSAFDKNGIQWVINPLDEFALTKAIKLQETQGATVTVINVGDAGTEAVIRKALAIGANDAVRVNTDPKDSFSVAKEIANVAQNGGYDLVLCGKESIDYNGGAVPGMVAQLLNQPFVNACVGLDVNGSEATAVREIEGGKETISVKLPAVIAGQKGMVDEKDLITCDRNALVLCENLVNLINNPNLLESTAENGYKKFLEIYDKTKTDFENFISKIDNKIERS